MKKIFRIEGMPCASCALSRTIREENGKIYKPQTLNSNSNLTIVSMIPGDQKVAGCFNFSFGGFL